MKITNFIIDNSIKYVSVLLVILALGWGGRELHRALPSELSVGLNAPLEQTLSNLIALTEKGKPINKDPYVSSTYHPSEVLYEPVLAYQQHRFEDARELLKPLVKQGDVDAMFWLGIATYKSNAFGGGKGARLFKQAADLGHPYAALMLDDTEECRQRMLGYCNSKWGELGRKILTERAAQGDAKAAYRLFLDAPYKRSGFDVLFDDSYKGGGRFSLLVKAAEAGMKQHYYRPLIDLIERYVHQRISLDPFNYEKKPLSESEQGTLRKILKLAENNNSLDGLFINEYIGGPGYYNNTAERFLPFFGQSKHFRVDLYYLNRAPENRRYLVQGFARNIAYDNEHPIYFEGRKDDEHARFFLNRLDETDFLPLSDKEKAEAEVLAKKYVKQNKPIITIDESKTGF